MLNVLYLVHNLADPAVRRRVLMLSAGGACVTLAGFRRSEQAISDIAGVAPVDLGASHDGRFAQRLVAVLAAATSIGSALKGSPRPDVIVARNLEMLALAGRTKAAFQGADIPVVYECLDIHRLLLRDDFFGTMLRGAERYLARDVKLLLTSSPAFVRNYFAARGQVSAPVELIENKHFEPLPPAPGDREEIERSVGSAWRIGWFGALRCRRSLEILSAFSRRLKGRFEVTLRGRPALTEFSDFHRAVSAEPYMSFEGPYRSPEDIEAIYRQVHFSWAIDFFEEGQNSKWLLPNRLYEGCRFGTVPIAMAGTETARFLQDRGIGLVLAEPSASALEQALGDMDEERFGTARRKLLAADRKTWICDRQDCVALVSKLGRLSKTPLDSTAEVLA